MVPVILPLSLEPFGYDHREGPLATWFADSKVTTSPVACLKAVVPLKPHCGQSPGAACTGAAPASSPAAAIAVAAAHSGHLCKKLVSFMMDGPFSLCPLVSEPLS
jgi:hypothetical protein